MRTKVTAATADPAAWWRGAAEWSVRLARRIRANPSPAAFACLIGSLGFLNAWGARDTFTGIMGLTIAVVALMSEYLGSTLALDAERAAGDRNYGRAAVCAGLVALVFAPLNVWGTHRAYEAATAPALERERATAQAAIDAERGRLEAAIASLDAKIDDRQAKIDAIPTDIYGSRVEILQRPQLEILRGLSAERAELRRELEAAPKTAVATRPLPDALVWLGGVMLELAKVLGLWAVGGSSASANLAAARPRQQANAGRALAQLRWAKV